MPKRQSDWEFCSTPYLVRYKPSGTYYARASIGGRALRWSLKTDSLSLAKRLLPSQLADKRAVAGRLQGAGMTVAECAAVWLARKATETNPKSRAQKYRLECWGAIKALWPAAELTPAASVTLEALRPWETLARAKFGATRFNGQLTVLRGAFEVAVESGALVANPAKRIKRAKVPLTPPDMPTTADFEALLARLEQSRSHAAALVKLLAYTGMRIDEAQHLVRADVDLKANRLTVRVTKNGKPRTIPLLAQAVELFREDWTAVFKSLKHHPRKALETACRAVGLDMTPHDLRHLFATRCIESGVDVHTVAGWLGHQDGGALLLKRYAHLRDEHSQAMAAKVRV